MPLLTQKEKRGEEVAMRPVDEASERYVLLTERIVLECDQCAERMVLFGTEEDWQSERTVFECECGEVLTLQDRYDEYDDGEDEEEDEEEPWSTLNSELTPEEDLSIRELLRQLRTDKP